MTKQKPLHREKVLHLRDVGGVLHPFHQVPQLLTRALVVVSGLQMKQGHIQGRHILEEREPKRTYVLQAELQLLLVRHEVLSHLHCQVVERQNAVKKRQYLNQTNQIKRYFYSTFQKK